MLHKEEVVDYSIFLHNFVSFHVATLHLPRPRGIIAGCTHILLMKTCWLHYLCSAVECFECIQTVVVARKSSFSVVII